MESLGRLFSCRGLSLIFQGRRHKLLDSDSDVHLLGFGFRGTAWGWEYEALAEDQGTTDYSTIITI